MLKTVQRAPLAWDESTPAAMRRRVGRRAGCVLLTTSIALAALAIVCTTGASARAYAPDPNY